MAFNPKIHHRRSIRLKGYDYSASGLYFITICVQHRKCLFGNISNAEMRLNDFGIVAFNHWQKLPERFKNIATDIFQIMPNHMHGIIEINESVGAGLAPAHDGTDGSIVVANGRARASPAPTIGDIVGAYKSLVSNECLKIFKQKYWGTMGKLWQRDYYEHIIRDEQSYLNISNYIVNNPNNWKEDNFYND